MTKSGERDLVEFLVGLGLGILGGTLACQAYQNCTEEEKRVWEQNRIMHHGALGAILFPMALSTMNSGLTGAAMGLMLTDLQDIDEW
ncbi:MAG: hypothetical protein ACTSPB_26625 [Candidatus Thorarchaeota archaeon]